MTTINSSAIASHPHFTRQNSPASGRPTMASHHVTPLTPPGSKLANDRPPDVPQWRLALFDRMFEQVQQKLTERRHADTHGSAPTSGGLSRTEFRECDAAAQWITAALMSSSTR